MGFIKWFLHNFGFFFGVLFIIYLYLIIHRIILLYDILRYVPDKNIDINKCNYNALMFLMPYFKKLDDLKNKNGHSADALIDAIWAEMDCKISVHFMAINGYIYSLILIGFAGTIFGSIGAFTQMFQGLAQNIPPVTVFIKAWNSGLSTALYTSLGSAAIGGFMVSLLYSRYLMTKAKKLETMLSLTISDILENGLIHYENSGNDKWQEINAESMN